ncbi:MAG: NAD-dependent epimerase/dehydratase family protein [Chloroflexi bacterium]|nr:NAD-dependent epimerase/dehydratase family protein [Chloroflexota bacterium]
MARYLVAGAAGFIAARVAELLLADGHQVVGIDNLNDAYDVQMKDYRLGKLIAQPGFSFHKIDIANKDKVLSLADTDPFEAIINLAARAGVRASVEDPWVYVDTNVTGTLNLLEFARQTETPKFVMASTSSIYGQDAPLPTPESTESSRPLQPYAASKKGAEAMCHAYHFLNGIDVTVVRYFTVYGPSGRPDMSMFRFIRWIVEGETVQLNGDGTQSRGFTYVDDIARGTIEALKPVGYEIVNLGGHEAITMNELIALIEKLTGKEATVEQLPFHKADMQANQADVEKAGRLLGWEPSVGLEDGVARSVAWYMAEREWASQIRIN